MLVDNVLESASNSRCKVANVARFESDIVQFLSSCSFYRCSFDGKNGGEMVQVEYERYIKPDEADEETVSV